MLLGLGPVDDHYSFDEIYNLKVGKRKSLGVYQYDLIFIHLVSTRN